MSQSRRVVDGHLSPLLRCLLIGAPIVVTSRFGALYGLCTAASAPSPLQQGGMVLDFRVLDGNPADSTLVEAFLKRHVEIYCRPPRQAANVQISAFSASRLCALSDSRRRNGALYVEMRGLRIGTSSRNDSLLHKLYDCTIHMGLVITHPALQLHLSRWFLPRRSSTKGFSWGAYGAYGAPS